MQRLWSADELGERWSLLAEDLALLAGRVDAGKLGFAVQLAFWRQHGRFPDEEADVAPAVVAHLAAQIGVGADALDGYAWAGRSGRRHRVAIIDHLAVAAFDEAAEARFRRWLADDALPREFAAPALDEELSAWFARSRVTRPGAYRLAASCAQPRPRMTTRPCNGRPTGWTPGCATGLAPCWLTRATAPPTPAWPPIPAGSAWKAS